MAVRVASQQADSDPVLAVRVQELRQAHAESVRAVAQRWEQGLRGLLGLAGLSGVIGAPLASGGLSPGARIAIGILLAATLVMAGVGLGLAMSAAYGSTHVSEPPSSLVMLEEQRWRLAERRRRQLVWGRVLAFTSLVLFAATIVLVWINPGHA